MMRALTLIIIAAAAAIEVFNPGPAAAQERFALVIGNSSYQSVPQLPNPVRDAAAMSTFLMTAGFDVTTALDVDQAAMRRAVLDFAQRLADKSDEKTVALLFFAGHGVQVNGENYLVPIDAHIKSEADVPLQAVRFADIMDTLERIGKKTRLIFLDACRNNPFGDGKTPQGLAIVNVPTGSLVVYSTSPGATAEDGAGGNSPFTEALMSVGRNPGEPIENALKDVRLAVNKETVGRQVPWDVSSLIEPFSFFPGKGGDTIPAPSQAAAPASGAPSTPAPGPGVTLNDERSSAFWREKLKSIPADQAHDIAVREDRIVVYRVVLELFPQARFVAEFRAIVDRRIEMWAWFDAVNLNTVAGYDAFLQLYADGDLAETARRLRDRARLRSLFAEETPGALVAASSAGTSGTPDVKTVIKEVPVVQTVIKEVPVLKTVTVEVPSACRCSGPGPGPGRVLGPEPRSPVFGGSRGGPGFGGGGGGFGHR